MGKKLTKRQKTELRKKRSLKKIKKKEAEDSKGISRKKIKNALRPEIYVVLKVISIILIPVLYIVYSPLLIFAVIFSFVMIFFTKKTENYINHSYIKSNHIKIPKIDSIVALLVLIITFSGMLLSTNMAHHGQSDAWMEFTIKMENTGSCLTGKRTILPNNHHMKFGTADIPADLPNKGERPKNFSMDDLPLEAVFSMMLSSVNSVLIFLVPLSSGVTLIAYFIKRHKFDDKMNEIINVDYKEFNEEDYERLFSFGLIKDESLEEDIENKNDLDTKTKKQA